LDVATVADIGDDVNGFAVSLVDGVRELLERLPTSRREPELAVLRRHRERRGESDAPGSAGDHDGLLVARFKFVANVGPCLRLAALMEAGGDPKLGAIPAPFPANSGDGH